MGLLYSNYLFLRNIVCSLLQNESALNVEEENTDTHDVPPNNEQCNDLCSLNDRNNFPEPISSNEVPCADNKSDKPDIEESFSPDMKQECPKWWAALLSFLFSVIAMSKGRGSHATILPQLNKRAVKLWLRLFTISYAISSTVAAETSKDGHPLKLDVDCSLITTLVATLVFFAGFLFVLIAWQWAIFKKRNQARHEDGCTGEVPPNSTDKEQEAEELIANEIDEADQEIHSKECSTKEVPPSREVPSSSVDEEGEADKSIVGMDNGTEQSIQEEYQPELAELSSGLTDASSVKDKNKGTDLRAELNVNVKEDNLEKADSATRSQVQDDGWSKSIFVQNESIVYPGKSRLIPSSTTEQQQVQSSVDATTEAVSSPAQSREGEVLHQQVTAQVIATNKLHLDDALVATEDATAYGKSGGASAAVVYEEEAEHDSNMRNLHFQEQHEHVPNPTRPEDTVGKYIIVAQEQHPMYEPDKAEYVYLPPCPHPSLLASPPPPATTPAKCVREIEVTNTGEGGFVIRRCLMEIELSDELQMKS